MDIEKLQTIIAYNENEVEEQKELQNIRSKDKVWIDLIDPTDEVIKKVTDYFHLDQDAVELFRNKSKKPQIRLLEDHIFAVLLDIKFKNSQTAVTEGVYLFCGKNWLIAIHIHLMLIWKKAYANYYNTKTKSYCRILSRHYSIVCCQS